MAYIPRLVKKKLGEILIEAGLVREVQINEALKQQKGSGEPLGEVLVRMGILKEEDIAYALARQYGLPYIDASRYAIQGDFMSLIPTALMEQQRMVVLDRIGDFLIIAIAGVIDTDVLDQIEKKTKCQIFLYVSTYTQVREAIKKHYQRA